MQKIWLGTVSFVASLQRYVDWLLQTGLSKLYDLSKTVTENAFFNVKLHSKQNRPMLSCVVCSAQECAHVTFRLCFSLFCFTVIRAYFVN